jgi:EpsI family protein
LYLFFALPVPGAILGAFSVYLQSGAAHIATWTLRLIGMPVVLTQHCLELPHIQLDVVRECSGINHIIALMSLAIPIAFFADISALFRLVLVIFSFFLGIFLNGLRVAMIGLWSVNHRDLHGPVSTLFTSSIFFTGLIVLLFITYLPLFRKRRRVKGAQEAGKAGSGEGEARTSWSAAVGIGTLIFLGTAAIMYIATPQPVPLRAHLAGFPIMIGDWQGKDVQELAEGLDRIAADDVIKRIYRNSSGRSMGLYVGYFALQGRGRKVSSYRFDDPRGGASIVKIPGDSGEHDLVRTLLDDRGVRREAYYWYDIDGRQVLSKYAAKLVSVANGIFRRRTNAALVVFVANPEGGEVAPEAPASAERFDFMKLAIPKLREYLTTP